LRYKFSLLSHTLAQSKPEGSHEPRSTKSFFESLNSPKRFGRGADNDDEKSDPTVLSLAVGKLTTTLSTL